MLATADNETTAEVSTSVETRPLRLLIKVKRIEHGPEEIAEARSRGLIVPQEENAEEFLPDVTRRLGWFWAYDPRVEETRQERQERYLADDRLIDMKGYARVICRSYALVKDNKYESDAVRRLVENDAELTELARQHMLGQQGSDLEAVKALLLAEQEEKLLRAMPPPRDRVGQSSLWLVSDAVKDGRRKERLDRWYEKARSRSGRPPGSKTRNRRAAS